MFPKNLYHTKIRSAGEHCIIQRYDKLSISKKKSQKNAELHKIMYQNDEREGWGNSKFKIQNSKFKIQNYEEQVLVSSSRLGIAQVNLLSALAPQRRFKITRRNTRFLLAMINFLPLQMDD